MFRDACESVASEFVARPIDFTVEFEVQARLYEELRRRLADIDALRTNGKHPSLTHTSDGYKRAYWTTIESKWRESDALTRVHPELTVQENERIDLAVLGETVDAVEWHDGSKRFSASDLDAAFEVKYVKNKPRFPTTAAASELAALSDDELRDALDVEENSLGPDFEELARLPDDVETFLLLVSNKNYLYCPPVTEGERAHNRAYERLGRIAREWLTATGEAADTAVLYATPRQYQWFVEP
ncbi:MULTISPECIES: hypothetical protein [Halobacterium]|uniref:hypothetical protein n=1 Tax=Halobacterium TaxID=2239 RepID=UPI00073EB351|nr:MULTISPECIES: hypothetical protein [Halobacterium]MCG1001861.1 hypothetical protein [Halobacterium noricense]